MRVLRRRILDGAGLPYVYVEYDRNWHLPGDLHPDARAAQAIAVAVAERLGARVDNCCRQADRILRSADSAKAMP